MRPYFHARPAARDGGDPEWADGELFLFVIFVEEVEFAWVRRRRPGGNGRFWVFRMI
jgi:hypothetical protein